MSARSRSHGGSSCRDFTFGSWQFVGARQEAEELQTHSAPKCWQLLPGSQLVKCPLIGLPFPTGSGQEALEGQVALPILSLTPLGFSEGFGMVGRESVHHHWWLVPLSSEHRLSVAKEWQQSQGCSLRSGFFRTGKSLLFPGFPGCCPRGDGTEPAWRTPSGRAGNSRMARQEHLEGINTSPQQELGRGENKAGEGKPGQNKMVLVGKGIPAPRRGGRNG